MLEIMYHARVEAEFSAAHFLSHYQGKCENLHGHNYRVQIWAKGKELGEGGMLADFALLKRALREAIEPLDHSNLNNLDFFKSNGSTSDPVSADPSAERIAFFIFEKVREKLPELGINSALLYAVDVFENDRSLARYEIE